MKRLAFILALAVFAGCGVPDRYPFRNDGHPDRTRLKKPCDTPDGLILPRPK